MSETRAEHLAWCKKRALEYLPSNPDEAFASMVSDLRKHEETAYHVGIDLGMRLKLGGFMQKQSDVQKWVEGFN